MTGAQGLDFVVVGAGIAGASLAYRLAEAGSVLLLEQESQPGYHATGRSAAMFMESYGTPAVRALTRASRAFYDNPPDGFCEGSLLSPRGVIYLAGPEDGSLLDGTYEALAATGGVVGRIGAADILRLVPALREERVLAGVLESDAMDIDVHSLHQGFLRGMRRRGGSLRSNAQVVRGQRLDGAWLLTLANGDQVRARSVINSAGAWADEVAGVFGVARIGLEPRRRTAFTFDGPPAMEFSGWPVVCGIREDYYFKPDAGRLLGSPSNADPTVPHDVVPEELDVATGIFHIERVSRMTIRRPHRTWAGLRSFVRDGDLVIGWDQQCDGFFWLAGQGGYGIQTAAAASELAAALVLGRAVPEPMARHGVHAEHVSPGRLGGPCNDALR